MLKIVRIKRRHRKKDTFSIDYDIVFGLVARIHRDMRISI